MVGSFLSWAWPAAAGAVVGAARFRADLVGKLRRAWALRASDGRRTPDSGCSAYRFQRVAMRGTGLQATTAVAPGIALTSRHGTCYNLPAGVDRRRACQPTFDHDPFLSPARTLVVEQACPSLFFHFVLDPN